MVSPHADSMQQNSDNPARNLTLNRDCVLLPLSVISVFLFDKSHLASERKQTPNGTHAGIVRLLPQNQDTYFTTPPPPTVKCEFWFLEVFPTPFGGRVRATQPFGRIGARPSQLCTRAQERVRKARLGTSVSTGVCPRLRRWEHPWESKDPLRDFTTLRSDVKSRKPASRQSGEQQAEMRFHRVIILPLRRTAISKGIGHHDHLHSR